MTESSINSVLFVCLGNICRSPSAHGVFRHMLKTAGEGVKVDSAGTAASHRGGSPDKRSLKVAKARGYEFSDLRARKVTDQDFEQFDLVLAMDNENLQDLQAICPPEHQAKVKLFMHYAQKHQDQSEVPDPYYGGAAGFEYVLDLIEDASSGLLASITKNR